MSIVNNILNIKANLPEHVTLVAVSKTKSNTAILEAYNSGQRVFGENKVQELVEKQAVLPKDIQWHLIGHLQRNKVKYIAPFVNLIHAVDSLKLLVEINKQAKKNNKIINCLLQIKIAQEDTKFGLTKDEALHILNSEVYIQCKHVSIVGLMGMATFTTNQEQLTQEFTSLKLVFNEFKVNNPKLNILSMGMSGDYQLAIDCGSNMIRVGSSIFGTRF